MRLLADRFLGMCRAAGWAVCEAEEGDCSMTAGCALGVSVASIGSSANGTLSHALSLSFACARSHGTVRSSGRRLPGCRQGREGAWHCGAGRRDIAYHPAAHHRAEACSHRRPNDPDARMVRREMGSSAVRVVPGSHFHVQSQRSRKLEASPSGRCVQARTIR